MSTPLGASEAAQELARLISDTIWATYDDEFGYATEKRASNARFGTRSFHPDNLWSFWGQFDTPNKDQFVALAVSAESAGTAGARELVAWINGDLLARLSGESS